MKKDKIKPELLEKQIKFLWVLNGNAQEFVLTLKDIDLYTVNYTGTSNEGDFIVENGEVFILWENGNKENISEYTQVERTELIPIDSSLYDAVLTKLKEVRLSLVSSNQNAVVAAKNIITELSNFNSIKHRKSWINVTYRSEWEEGVVDTEAKLNLDTGEIFDIETSDEGSDYEIHIRDLIYYTDNKDISFEYAVETGSPFYNYFIESDDLSEANELIN